VLGNDLESVTHRHVHCLNHSGIDHLADGAAILRGLACGKIDANERHEIPPVELGSDNGFVLVDLSGF
jgi:hypothetical protein